MTVSEEGNISTSSSAGTSVKQKAVAYGGGTAVGAAMMMLIEKIPDPTLKELATLAVPASAIFISNVSTSIYETSKLSIGGFRRRRYLKKKIKEIEEALASPLDDLVLEADLKSALSGARRELIIGTLVAPTPTSPGDEGAS